MAFLTEPEPARGRALDVLPAVRRIVAANPGPMTYYGTNTYLIETVEGIVVLDPGPDDSDHVAAILSAAHGRISHILLSHTHPDHVGATAALRAATGAKVYAYRVSADPNFEPDVALEDGDSVAGLTALHTPGHASDHLCFAMPGGILFTADHVMAWSTSVVSPPSGDMAAYFMSLRRLLAREDRIYLAGHGPPLEHPHAYVRELLAHRIMRENAIANALRDGPTDTHTLMDRLYSKLDPMLRRAAERNVLAHLLKLQAEGRARQAGNIWMAAENTLNVP
ncbi:MAG: MBL fold metallo-hydrolase [Acidobacteriia bacterium]|nr:MBL fold metallo-hydrolase [Methyloceanibacter sp.]MBX5471129.1 MBL fold metallo-hydrolase [Acetobacteraceae bacterium]MCL6490917.1 MBL fold metallo-hydrolase [Terriglobia bacterium]